MHRNKPCPCGSGTKYKSCCGPLLVGSVAETAEALMRSRFTAYALGEAEYVMATTHPHSPHRREDILAWLQELRAFCERTTFHSLTVFEATQTRTTGFVTFHAKLEEDGENTSFTEKSRFEKLGGRWLYVGAVT